MRRADARVYMHTRGIKMIIGIDLGTTNSLVCVYRNGKAEIIPNSLGENLTPSVVSMDEQGNLIVGAVAKERLVTHPELTAASFKRFMGTDKKINLGTKSFTPQELSSFVVRRLKEDAERCLGEEVHEAVVSVPAYFNDSQRAATREAGLLAGIKVERIVNEPSAAALACSMASGKDEQSYLVFDFGGGTLDVSIVDYFENVIEIVAVSGDNHLGGNDFDRKIAEYFCQSHNIDFDGLGSGQQATLLRLSERCKRELTEKEVTFLHFEIDGEDKAVVFNNEILVQCCSGLFDRASAAIKNALRDSGYSAEDIDEVVLVGGSGKMPVVSYFLESLLGKKPVMPGSPDELVAQGAGIYAGIKDRNEEIKDVVLTDICPFTLGTSIINRNDYKRDIMSPVIERNTTLPASKSEYYTNVGERQKEVRIKIYQGESVYCDENLYLGEVHLDINAQHAYEANIEVTFSYDINGILVVDVLSKNNNNACQKVFTSKSIKLGERELEEKVKELQRYKTNPVGDERNNLLFARGERLYREITGTNRERVMMALQEFGAAIKSGDKQAVKNMRKSLATFFDTLEDLYEQ